MEKTIMSLHAQTSIHAGSGQQDSVIDLPVQRESHTGYPCVFGSSMKGALRCHAESWDMDDKEDDKEKEQERKKLVDRLFGKGGDNNNGNTGAMLVSDARLLLLPVRSLTGQFRWVTSPAVLKRYKADMKRFGRECDLSIPSVEPGNVLTPTNISLLYLEEYRFSRPDNGIGEELAIWVKELSAMIDYDDAEKMMKEQLAIISDADFAYLSSYTLPVNPHISIDSKTKTTITGALWYEETLPPDTVLYVGLAVDSERTEQGGVGARELMEAFGCLFSQPGNQWIQIGGNETVGMGWCRVKLPEGRQEDDHSDH